MKKIFFLLVFVAFSINGNSQCVSGPTTLYVGQTYTFSSINGAQCTSCYDWDINGNPTSSDNSTQGNIQIVGSDIGQTVNIKILSAGTFSLTVTYFNENGCNQCTQKFTAITPVALPTQNCFGFDPANLAFSQGQPLNTSEGVLNYGYIGSPYGTPISSAGLTFTWYFKFFDGTLLTLNGQNPIFRELCPSNPVMSFALIVSNGVQTKQYRSIYPGFNYLIPGISGPNTPTCFIHSNCFDGRSSINKLNSKIIVSPNPTTSTIKFEGNDLNNYKVSIFNSNGNEIIKNSKIDQNISIEKQEKGVYIYIITDENGFEQKGKIIKE
ncbi:T9SS type A sorting domain-containing protein [Flavobacterium sp.]|uniref:T9SS type A sorting domain-containing protein n=1 Tax=Flavobacterium sp. TaxID=239 RepID=UPI0026217814|nr:T9SS type A sorting domain-containing protein [Flavobacterium sp.]